MGVNEIGIQCLLAVHFSSLIPKCFLVQVITSLSSYKTVKIFG